MKSTFSGVLMTARLLTCMVLVAYRATAQETNDQPPKLFLNCQANCYYEYALSELSFFDFVRDRYVADIEILIQSQNTGGGGRAYSLTFVGQKQFVGISDTLRFVTRPTDTDDMIRKQYVKVLKQGLVRYVLETDLITQVTVNYAKRKPQEKQQHEKDPWNYWVFNLGGNAAANGESNRTYVGLNGNFRVNRITAESKFNCNGYYNLNTSRYVVNGENIRVDNIGYGFSALYVKGFSEHWSAGGFYRGSHSVFANIDYSQSVAPALEFSIFPISEVMRRQFRWVYQVGARDLNYIETTIYDKNRETLPFHQVTGIFGVVEPWGTMSAEVNAYQYFHDLSKNRFSLELDLSWRVVEGLFLRLNGSASLINNQISLAKSSGAAADFLLNGRQLPTSFNYNSSIGINYTFGSIHNTAVNPRFSGVD